MNEAGHQQRAQDIEQTIQDLGDPRTRPHICAVALEGYWGAAFHWIIVGCIRKHQWHTDSHVGLVQRLKQLGEMQVATDWENLERVRTGGWYTYQATPTDVSEAEQYWQGIKTWATS